MVNDLDSVGMMGNCELQTMVELRFDILRLVEIRLADGEV